MKTSTAIFGAPGCGKTRTLTNLIAEIAMTTPNIAVVSFTRAAAGVLTSRLHSKIRYIGTLHALAFKILSLSKNQIVDGDKFIKQMSIGEDEYQMAMSVYNFSYHNHCLLPYAHVELGCILPYARLEYIVESYKRWKQTLEYIDFNDMIALAIDKISKDTTFEKYDVIVVDEAQDCTNVQWKFVIALLKPDGKLIMGGDDDQSIFTWAGANPHGMVSMAKEKVILEQSYRLPKAAHKIAEATVTQIKSRVPKVYKPTDANGQVEFATYYDPILYPNKHTVLCRDRWQLNDVEELYMQRGIVYTRNGEYSMSDRPRFQLYKALVLEDYNTIKRLSKYLKTKFKDDHSAAVSSGLNAVDVSWHKERDYLNIVDPLSESRVHLSTIHGFKGEEDDHIILMADCTGTTEMSMDNTVAYENEVRVWYVGLTRTKNQLTIVGNNYFIQQRG